MTKPASPQIPDELRPYLDTIADRLLSGHAAVMIGAGFSKNAISQGSGPEFPDWSQMGDRFFERLHGRPPGPDDKYLQIPALAHQVEAAFGRPALDQMLRDAIPDLQNEPSPLHIALLDLPWSDVFTTNYDTLLERARRSVISQRYDLVLKPDDLTHSNRPRIIKLHGSLPSERPFNITDEDYRRYPQVFAPFVNAVRQALLENTLCLIGFSGDDPNFLQWVGWIHDNLGQRNSSMIYVVGLLELSPSQRTLFERRNIIPVDMSACLGPGDNHSRALERFIDYLKYRRSADNQLDWPGTEESEPASDDTNEAGTIGKAVELWKTQRRRYAGWVVLPEDLRFPLWLKTSAWTHKLPAADALPALLDLEFGFELTWRFEKCLCPIFENQTAFLETTIDRYWPATDSGASIKSLSLDGSNLQARGITLEDIRHKCHYLLLAMMRNYREDGLSAKWDEACKKIEAVLPSLSLEHKAQFHYERALFALFALNLKQLKTRLAEWRHNEALPFWAAKKAGLLAEIGRVSEATQILEQSLDAIRTKLNLAPLKKDYTLVSQESFVMYLLHAVRQGPRLNAPDQSDAQRQRQEFSQRWHVLNQYKCDPWQEFETFEHKLQRPPATTSGVTETPTFDIGRSVQTHHWGGWNKEALGAYNFLRFCEDAGIPFRVSNCAIATKSATGTLTRIAHDSSYWALATLVRIGDTKAVDEIFDRGSLAGMSTPTVDSLIERYLESLRLAVPDIATGDRRRNANFGTLLAGVLPEILSRLCCKSSQLARERLLDWLLDVYRTEHRSNYQGIGKLVQRLLVSSSANERIGMIPKLMEFPILTDRDAIDEREYPNPFEYFDLPKDLRVNDAGVHDMPLDVFFHGASSTDTAARRRAVSVLGTLHAAKLLPKRFSERFGKVLWSRVDEHGLPSGTNYYRFAFLALPYPAEVDPAEHFIRYVRAAKFPVQKSETHTTIGIGVHQGVSLCHDICAARDIGWSKDDVLSIVHRLIQWWDNDKSHWLRAQDKEHFSSIADDLGKQLKDLVRTLATVVLRYSDSVNDDITRSAVTRVATECSEYEVPALRLEVACAYAYAGVRSPVLRRVEIAMTSHRTNAVIDALDAMDMIAHRAGSESDRGDLMELLRAAGEMIRWRRETALWATLKAVGSVVNEHPGAFVEDVESGVLIGLDHLVTETAVSGGRDAGINKNGLVHDLATKLVIRRAAVNLAHRLFEHYRARGRAIPKTIEAWQAVCRSDDEFMEIRNEWLAS